MTDAPPVIDTSGPTIDSPIGAIDAAGVIDAADVIDAELPCDGVVCGDSDPCTTDSCGAANVCQFLPIALPSGCSGPLFSCAGQTTCYAHCTTDTTWQASETSCAGWGGHLATVLSDAESSCIGGQLSGATNRAWIGYFQLTGSGEPLAEWQWISGSPGSSDTTWNATQPNQEGGAEQDCAFAQGPGGTWFDHECGFIEHGYICEK